MRRQWRIYWKLMRMHLLSGMEYKGWWLMLLQVMLVVVTDPISMVLLFSRFGAVGAWTMERVLLVYAMTVASFGLAEVFFRGFDSFPWRMLRTGGFDRVLLRPCPLVTQVAASVFHIHRIMRPLTSLCAVIWALSRMGVALTLRNFSMLTLALAGGMTFYGGVFVLTSGLAFYTIKGLEWIYLLTNASYQVTRCPQPYLPRIMRTTFTFVLPVLPVSFYPAAAVCGWGSPAWAGWLALPAGLAFMGIALVVWRVGVRHYASTGS